MAARADKQIEDTIAALQGDVTTLDNATAIEMLEAWQTTLDDADFDGADEIAGILAQIRAQLDSEEPDGTLIGELLGDLSNVTQEAADAADDEVSGKIQLLADLLGDTSDSLGS
ncbi:hypothetical protein [Deinococcus pimensis]|uniref:hypothetical protein n=1 Tax=Deinococcus pimensis TaxID=309888 RepID=UPI000484ADE6|nr:hypothetical protein [Deinococcus pimensis]